MDEEKNTEAVEVKENEAVDKKKGKRMIQCSDL